MKKLVVGLVMAVTMFTFVACGNKSEDTGKQDVKETIQVIHSQGTTKVVKNVKKAVVFELSILDTMDALGVEAEVAVPVSSLPSYLSKYESSVNAGAIKEPDMEAIYEFKPEVIFISGRQADFYDELNKIAPTVYVDLNAETYMEDVTRNVEMVGAIFGKEELAKEKLEELTAVVKEVQDITETKEEKALIILTNDGSLSAYGKGSRFGLIHDELGVKLADEAIEVSTHGQEASFEYIAKTNPDILYVVDRAQVAGGSVEGNETLNNELVNSTNAAKNGKVVYLDPECWYISGGGLTSVNRMVGEIKDSLK